MSRNAHKNAKKGLKRAKKQKEARRLQTLSPFRRAAHNGQIECYRGRTDEGIGTLMVLGHITSGSYAMAGFLIDFWCVGLKDAFGQKQIARAEFDQQIMPQWRTGGETIGKIEPEAARRLIAGAIRFSHQNGFRLPEHWDRYAAILGDLGDIAKADLSEFGVDGKLRYVGTQQFLRERLAKCSVDEFLRRPDVEFVFQAPGFDGDEETFDDDGEVFEDDEIRVENAIGEEPSDSP
jgi:hypothetical protein